MIFRKKEGVVFYHLNACCTAGCKSGAVVYINMRCNISGCKNVLLYMNIHFVLHIRLYKNMCIRLYMQECQMGATPCSERPLSQSRTSPQVPSSQLLLSVRLIHDPPSSTWSNFEDLISGLGPFSTQLWDLWPPSKQGPLPPALDCNCPELPDTFNFPERGAKWGHYNSLFVLIMGDPCLRH